MSDPSDLKVPKRDTIFLKKNRFFKSSVINGTCRFPISYPMPPVNASSVLFWTKGIHQGPVLNGLHRARQQCDDVGKLTPWKVLEENGVIFKTLENLKKTG